MNLPQLAHGVLLEALGELVHGLALLRGRDDPEVLHQARIAWRKFDAVLRLFVRRSALPAAMSPQRLRELLVRMGALRDWDVAGLVTLPALVRRCHPRTPALQTGWDALVLQWANARPVLRGGVLAALEDPQVERFLLAWAQWLDSGLLSAPGLLKGVGRKRPVSEWATRRLQAQFARLAPTPGPSSDRAALHQTRILAKRLRYGVEALRPLLPKRRAAHWHARAEALQKSMGTQRDLRQALEIVTSLEAAPEIVAFLGAVCAGLDAA